ncbi:MAG: response regulator [Gemmatimonadaceae bacterium]|nr:response regulator [Gemmatimonadaceae bacterium]MCW5826362.1 response regulator [Gemmatimonadaceae bacterium]
MRPPLRILLADDDLAMRDLLKTVLEAYDHEVVVHADGAAVWAAYEAEPSALVVLDWEMPGLDGLEVCRRIRQHPAGELSYVLLITARTKSADLEDVLAAGADDYLPKPVTAGDIAARLRIAERRIEVAAARRSAEEELRKARYLAGVGEVSLALQHEINNPLAALLTTATIIKEGMVEPSEIPASLTVIEEQAKRIVEVVKRLREVQTDQSVEYARGQRMVDLSGRHLR